MKLLRAAAILGWMFLAMQALSARAQSVGGGTCSVGSATIMPNPGTGCNQVVTQPTGTTLGINNLSISAFLAFPGSTSGTVTMVAATTGTAYTLTLPGSQPTAGNTFLSCTAANTSICSWAAGGGGGVTAVNTLTGNITLAAGTGIGLATAGNTLTFSNSGVTTFNTLSGAITLAAGTNISLGTSGNTVTVNSTASSVYTHTLTGTTPTVVNNSTTVAATDIDYLTLSGNVTSFSLTSNTTTADGETHKIIISQPASGGPYTLPTATALSPFTAGSGTTLVNSVPGGCPTIGTTQSSTAPSQFIAIIQYQAAFTQWIILGCQLSNTAQKSTSEFAISAGGGGWGQISSGGVLVSAIAQNAGHFTSLNANVVNAGSCTTPPAFNVFDGTTNVGTAVTAVNTATSKGAVNNVAETLTFNAGDVIGIYVSTAGATCTGTNFNPTAMIAEP